MMMERVQSQGEEIANSVSHGMGGIAALAGTPFIIVHAVKYGDGGFIAGTMVFAISIILLYLASTCLRVACPTPPVSPFSQPIRGYLMATLSGTFLSLPALPAIIS